jgi:signal transduction histidine kinase
MENYQNTQPVKVLLIEDDEDDYIIIRELFANINYSSFDVTWLSTYQDSLALLSQNIHDICIMDYRLGVNNGIDLLKEANDLGVSIPVIFLTGQDEYTVDVEAMKAGAADYLVKDTLTSPLLERSIRYTIERATAAEKLKRAYDELDDRVRQRTSELRETNEKLHKASEKIKSFAYSISHDLKSPSSSLIGLANRLYKNYGNHLDEKGKTYCKHIRKAAEQIYSMVGLINSFITTKEMPLKLEEIHLEDIFNDITAIYFEQLSKREINWVMPKKLPIIRADRMCIFRIFTNLVENALKYGGNDLSSIYLRIDENSSEYIISVKDDGKGIIKNATHDIFQPFERVGGNREIEGNGLGLAIVKEMVEKHGGNVWYDSGDGKGVTFYVSISKLI